ncbi:MAG: hypothetical protein JWO38_5604 [Gemmataceae bacterium]|nr:hypothetical protein [Gemmataceae bacterium]
MDATDSQPAGPTVFLVFGDLHGKMLPAFRLASCWAKDHGRVVAGLLQVGDMGYFPDPARIDKATLRHAEKDPLELGTFDVIEQNELADRVFDDPLCPPGLWFTAGNHEDFDALDQLARESGRQSDFAVDAYGHIRGIKDGQVVGLPRSFESFGEPLIPESATGEGPAAGLHVGAVWGVDGAGPNARQNLPERGYIWEKAVNQLVHREFDVLLSHDAPGDARRVGYGSKLLRCLVELAQPAFAFFGHYGGDGARSGADFGPTEVYHMAGLELGGKDGCPTSGSVGVLEWANGSGSFKYVPDDWLKTFTRHNWKWR